MANLAWLSVGHFDSEPIHMPVRWECDFPNDRTVTYDALTSLPRPFIHKAVKYTTDLALSAIVYISNLNRCCFTKSRDTALGFSALIYMSIPKIGFNTNICLLTPILLLSDIVIALVKYIFRK